MKRILSDYYKHYRNVMISNICLIVLIPLMYLFTDFSWENVWDMVILSLYILALALGIWSLVEYVITVPLKLKKQLAEMPEKESAKVLSQYPDAKLVDKHHYMEKHFVFFFANRIYLLRYSDIQAAELKRSGLKLTVNGYKKPITMPFPEYGTDAVALAYLRNKNPDIKIIRKETTV